MEDGSQAFQGGESAAPPNPNEGQITADGKTYTVYQYPKGVGTSGGRYPHMVVFYVNVNQKAKLVSPLGNRTFDLDLTKKTANQGIGVRATTSQTSNASIAQQAAATPSAQTGVVSATSKVIGGALDALKESMKFTTQYKRLDKAIALYVPNGIKSDYSTAYEEAASGGVMGTAFSALLSGQGVGAALSGGGAAAAQELLRSGASVVLGNSGKGIGAIVGGIAGGLAGGRISPNAVLKGAASGAATGGIAGAVLDNGIENSRALVDKLTGSVVNPRKELVFRHVNFRTFTFSYLFAPRNTNDVATIKAIIQAFKFHMHPELPTENAASGMYLIMPDEFDIEFYSHGKENDFISKIATCVLTDVSVDYAPAGQWSAFKQSGNPVMVALSLTFRELEPLVRNQIANGY